MPASKSMLRLLALGACAEVVTAFGTVARMGAADIGTESAGAAAVVPTSCLCESSGFWFCNVIGPQSLTGPLNTFDADTLASYASSCWAGCYQNPLYMRDATTGVAPGPAAPFWDACEPGFAQWQSSMCSNQFFAPSVSNTESIYEVLLLDTTDDNPFKASRLAQTRDDPVFISDICIDINTADDVNADDLTPRQRCADILEPGSIYFEGYDNCHKAARALDPSPFVASAPSSTYQETCDKLYKYYRRANVRWAQTCEFDATKGAAGKCAAKDNFAAADCRELQCGTFTARGVRLTDGTENDNAACSGAMP